MYTQESELSYPEDSTIKNANRIVQTLANFKIELNDEITKNIRQNSAQADALIQAFILLHERALLNQQIVIALLQESTEINRINAFFLQLSYRQSLYNINPETMLEIIKNNRNLSMINKTIHRFQTASEKNSFFDKETLFLICKHANLDQITYQSYVKNLIEAYSLLEDNALFTQENKAFIDQNSMKALDIAKIFYYLSKFNLLDSYKNKIPVELAEKIQLNLKDLKKYDLIDTEIIEALFKTSSGLSIYFEKTLCYKLKDPLTTKDMALAFLACPTYEDKSYLYSIFDKLYEKRLLNKSNFDAICKIPHKYLPKVYEALDSLPIHVVTTPEDFQKLFNKVCLEPEHALIIAYQNGNSINRFDHESHKKEVKDYLSITQVMDGVIDIQAHRHRFFKLSPALENLPSLPPEIMTHIASFGADESTFDEKTREKFAYEALSSRKPK